MRTLCSWKCRHRNTYSTHTDKHTYRQQYELMWHLLQLQLQLLLHTFVRTRFSLQLVNCVGACMRVRVCVFVWLFCSCSYSSSSFSFLTTLPLDSLLFCNVNNISKHVFNTTKLLFICSFSENFYFFFC